MAPRMLVPVVWWTLYWIGICDTLAKRAGPLVCPVRTYR